VERKVASSRPRSVVASWIQPLLRWVEMAAPCSAPLQMLALSTTWFTSWHQCEQQQNIIVGQEEPTMIHEKALKARRRSSQAVKRVDTPNLAETRPTWHRRQSVVHGTGIPIPTLLVFLHTSLPCLCMVTSSDIGAGGPSPGAIGRVVHLDKPDYARGRCGLCGCLREHLVCTAAGEQRSAELQKTTALLILEK
jgi:hypothetical protein